MVDTQVRYYKSLPEIRRVVKKLFDNLASDTKKLGATRRALNLSSLEPYIVVADVEFKSGEKLAWTNKRGQTTNVTFKKKTPSGRYIVEDDDANVFEVKPTELSRPGKTSTKPTAKTPAKPAAKAPVKPTAKKKAEPKIANFKRGDEVTYTDGRGKTKKATFVRKTGTGEFILKNPAGSEITLEDINSVKLVAPEPEDHDDTSDHDDAGDTSEDSGDESEDSGDESDSDEAPEDVPQGRRVRGGGGRSVPQADKVINKKVLQEADRMSEILRNQQKDYELAEHLKHLLTHGYSPEHSNTAKRLLTDVTKLHEEQKGLYEQALNNLHTLGKQHFPDDFRAITTKIANDLKRRFKDKYSKFEVKYAMATGTYPPDKSQGSLATFFFAYIMIDNLQGPKAMQDFVVVLTQVIGRGDTKNTDVDAIKPKPISEPESLLEFDEKNKKYKGWSDEQKIEEMYRIDEENKKREQRNAKRVGKKVERESKPRIDRQNFVRAVNKYQSPAWMTKHNLGEPFGTDVEKAEGIILTALEMDGLIENAFPTRIPLKDEDMKFTHKDVLKGLVDRKTGIVRVVLKNNINTKEKAHHVWEDVAADVKNILKTQHPRYRNGLNAQEPRIADVIINGLKEQRFVIDFKFSRPDEIGTDLSPKFWKALREEEGLDENAITEVQKTLKDILGIRHSGGPSKGNPNHQEDDDTDDANDDDNADEVSTSRRARGAR